MQKPEIHLPSSKLISIFAFIVIGLLAAWYAILAVSFSADDIREKTLSALSQHIGAEVEAIDLQHFSLFPMPELILNSVQVKNHPKSHQPSMLRAPSIKITPSLASIFNDLIVKVTFHNPKIGFETFADNTNSWDLPESNIEDDANIALLQQVSFVNASLNYINPSVRRDFTINNISLGINFNSALDYVVKGKFKLARDKFNIYAKSSVSGERNLSLKNKYSEYKFEGNIDSETGNITGNHSFDSKDIGQLLEVFIKAGDEVPKISSDKPMPLTFSSNIKSEGDRISFSEIALGGGYIEGDGAAVVKLTATPKVLLNLNLKTLLIDKILQRGVFDEFISSTGSGASIDGNRIALPSDKRSSLPDGLNISLSIKSDDAVISGLSLKKMKLSATLDKAAIDVAQFSGEVSGGGQFLLKGKVEGSYDGLAFKGEADAAGKNLDVSIAPLLPENDKRTLIIPDNFKRFRVHTNLFISPAVMRLSEAVIRIENMQIIGTLVRQIAKRQYDNLDNISNTSSGYRYEGAFRLNNFDLDEVWENQRSKNSDVSIFDWVKGLIKSSGNSNYNLKLSAVDYLFNKKKTENASLRLILNNQVFRLQEMNLPYNGSNIKGNASISFVGNNKPKISAKLQIDDIDTKELLSKDFSKDKSMWRDENGLWSRKEFNILGLNDIDLELGIDLGKLKHAKYEIENIKSNLLISDGAFLLKNISANIWGGSISAYGKMLIAKLPTFTGNINFNGFDFSKLHGITDLFSNLYGRGSLRGDFSTTGVNPYSAVKNMKGSLSFASSGLKVIGFNLANMVRAANAVRSIKDIDKLIKFANRSGEAKIDTVQGNMNIDAGYLRTPTMAIRTPVGNGNIRGQINLMDWNSNIGISIALAALSATNPPNIRLLFIGPLKDVKRSLDTQSLESFIAKKSAERLLVNP